ncbi:MAG: 30S ribosome-binding factor RbfA [Erysipelothrix sp.]|jgi:ribosome-binding factor A|nr:30S ribosome-binding factor RbfA [Erysipelothrix sp.]
MSIKQERLEGTILKEVSEILSINVKNPKFGFVTITDVQLTRDYSFATIFVSFLNTKDIKSQDRLDELNRVKGVVRGELAKRLTIRKVPELIFKIDDSIDKGNRIEEILHDIKETKD